MSLVETPETFAFISPASNQKLDVFIDGSGDTRKHLNAEIDYPYSAGFTIANQESQLQGYGVTARMDTYTQHTLVLELRAIVAFFSLLREHYAGLCNATISYMVHLDNDAVVRIMNNIEALRTSKKELFDVAKKEYDQIQELTENLKVSYSWVKGHATNPFNRAADAMARAAFRSWQEDGHFSSTIRRNALEEKLLTQNLLTVQEFCSHLGDETFTSSNTFYHFTAKEKEEFISRKKEEQAQRKALWDNSEKIMTTFSRSVIDGKPFVVLSCSYNGETYHSEPFEPQGRVKYLTELKALLHAIGFYRSCFNNDNLKPLSIHTDLAFAGETLNRIMKGKEPCIPHNDTAIENSIAELRQIIQRMSLRAVVDKTDAMRDFLVASKAHLKSFCSVSA